MLLVSAEVVASVLGLLSAADAFKENKNTEKSMVKQKIHVYTTLKNLL